MSGYDDPTPPSEFKIWPGYSSSEDAIGRIAGEATTAIDRFIEMLLRCELASMLLDRNGNMHPLDASFWGKLSRADARNILRQQDTSKINFISMRNSSLFRSLPRDCRPVFLTKELDEKLPRKAKMTEPAEEAVGSSVVASKNKGGRPQKHDWDSIWVEMCAYIDREGPPNEYAVLVKHIQNLLGEAAPAPSALHSKAKLLIDRIRCDQGRAPIT